MLKFIRKIFWRNRGLGNICNEIDLRDREFISLLLRIPKKDSLEQYVSEVLDQKNSNSCVAHCVAHAVSIMENKSGFDYGIPSRLFLYWNSRRQHDETVVDEGTYIRTCMQGLRLYGVPDESYWPFDLRKVNKKPTGFAPWMRSEPRKDGEYLSINAHGNSRVKKIRQAIVEGFPVVFGTSLPKSFLSARGPVIIDRPRDGEPMAGRHAMCIVGYDSDRFRILNSWGKVWRDNGFCWLTNEYIKWLESKDFTILKGWKRLRRDS